MLKRLSCLMTVYKGQFMKTRTFNPEHIYSVEHVLFNSFDEVVVTCLDNQLSAEFVEFVQCLTAALRVPLTVSGRIDSKEKAKTLFGLGADRIILNSCLWQDPEIVKELSSIYGRQAIVASIDVARGECGKLSAYCWSKKSPYSSLLPNHFNYIKDSIGEVLIQDVNRDGRVIGYCKDLVTAVMGAVGDSIPIHIGSCALTSWGQYIEVLSLRSVDAVAISNIHHMSRDGLLALREQCRISKINVRKP